MSNIEKSLKVLEIIKKKYVNVYLLTDVDNLEDYNSKVNWSCQRLTKEEFNLLKEVLG